MTMIADDYAAIRSHMFGDDTFLPKKNAEPAPEVKTGPTTILVADLPPHRFFGEIRPLIRQIRRSDQTVVWRPFPGPQEEFFTSQRNGEVREDDA